MACGGSQQSEKAQQVEEAADQVQDSAASMAKGLEEMAKGISALGGGDPNVKPVDPVSFRDLQTVLPEMAGWERSKPTVERMTSPVNFSQTTVRFTKGDASIEEKIVDSALNQLLVAPFAMFLTTGYEKETESGYEKSVKVGQYPGWEKWDTESKNGELNVIVNSRFIVQVEGQGLDNVKMLHTVMEQTDLKKLATLK
jgi:hypothetical protein